MAATITRDQLKSLERDNTADTSQTVAKALEEAGAEVVEFVRYALAE